MQGHEPWLRACGSQPASVTWCAAESDGEKWDLGGSGANVMRLRVDRHWRGDDDGRWRFVEAHRRDVVGIGGKSGVYTLLDAKTGEFIWSTLIGPGGDQGGMNWGTAFDGDRIYVSITNQHHISVQADAERRDLTNATVDRRLVGGARSGHRQDPLADRGSTGRDAARPGHRRRLGRWRR